MLRKTGFIIALWFVQFCSAQDIAPIFGARYFYKVQDSVRPMEHPVIPDEKLKQYLCKLGLVLIDTSHFVTEKQYGFDTILNVSQHIATKAFFMYQTEVSNAEYREFEKPSGVPSYYPDTMVWEDAEEGVHPKVMYYYQHAAYKDFPVVGVTHWQAMQFCKWKTETLNAQLRQKGFTGYRVVVSLPNEDEWLATYRASIVRWLEAQPKGSCSEGSGGTYLRFAMGCGKFRCNFQSLKTQRGVDLKKQLETGWNGKGIEVNPCKSNEPANGIYNLLGNVEEWTSTAANGALFNQQEFIYTTTSKIIPNTQTTIQPRILATYLHDPAAMKQYYSTKGGGWSDDLYYLEPAAMKFFPEHHSSSNIGFRYVVKCYPVN